MKKTLLLTSVILSCQIQAQAENHIYVAERLNDQRTQEMNAPQNQPIKTERKITAPFSSNQPLQMTKQELEQHPDYVVRALGGTLVEGNADKVQTLFPLYQRLESKYQDALLTKWSQAILAKAEPNYAESIQIYRQLISERPDFHIIRLQLAIALFEDHQTDAAKDQFQRLRAEPDLPHFVPIIDEYITAINQQNAWTFSGGFTYLNDPNINNAPKNGTTLGNWSAPERESAHGMALQLNIGKKWAWGNGFYNESRTAFNGKYYWDNKKYNEATLRQSLGIGYQTASVNFTLLPFIEQTWYAGGSPMSETVKRFSTSTGLSFENNYWLNSNWQLNNYYEYAEQRYRQRKHLNGYYHFVSLGAAYYPNSRQYWFGNINYNNTTTRDKDDSFHRYGITLGWGQEWYKGISTQLSLSYHRKNYQAPMPIFLITQHNKEFNTQFSIWHRAIHFWGITPRLTYQYSKVKSNHVFYSYDKHRVFLELSKRF